MIENDSSVRRVVALIDVTPIGCLVVNEVLIARTAANVVARHLKVGEEDAGQYTIRLPYLICLAQNCIAFNRNELQENRDHELVLSLSA